MSFDRNEPCPKGGEHQVKFNSGNPVCLKCGQYEFDDGGQLTLPASVDERGVVTVHLPGDEHH